MAMMDEEQSGSQRLNEARERDPKEARRTASARLPLAFAVPLIMAISLVLWLAIALVIRLLR